MLGHVYFFSLALGTQRTTWEDDLRALAWEKMPISSHKYEGAKPLKTLKTNNKILKKASGVKLKACQLFDHVRQIGEWNRLKLLEESWTQRRGRGVWCRRNGRKAENRDFVSKIPQEILTQSRWRHNMIRVTRIHERVKNVKKNRGLWSRGRWDHLMMRHYMAGVFCRREELLLVQTFF